MKPATMDSVTLLSVSSKNHGGRDLGSRLEGSRRGLAWARGIVLFPATLVLLAGFCAGAKAQITLAPNWNQQSPATPPPARFATSLAYDSAHAQVVMFGGFGDTGIVNDTWLWNGTNWTQVTGLSTSPQARSNQTMVYDAAQGEVVMFGGATSAQGSSRLNDTWLWNGTTASWTQVTGLSSTPPARSSAAMAYDAATGQVVLFGGLGTSDGDLGDTWVWYENNWYSETTPAGLTARFGASMAYDAALGEVILFGGFDQNGNEHNDIWAWNGSSWTQLSSANPPPPARDSAGMEYDPLLGQVVLFGGEQAIFNGTTYIYTNLSDTWVLTGNSPSNLTWTQQTYSTSPAARGTSPMVYDAAQSQVVMFGGYGNSGQLGDTWTWGTPQGFGNINVCPSGQSSPTPCSNTLTLTYNVLNATDFGPPVVVTQGAQGLDFSLASGSTCTGVVEAMSTCTVNVTFAPQAPGLRQGAVELFSSTNSTTPLTTTQIYGIGGAPLGAFSPLITFVQGNLSVSSPEGVAVDAAGDIFVANTGGDNVVKLPGGSNTAATVGYQPNFPSSVAVDGAGDVYIGQYGPTVLEVPAGCTQAQIQTCQKSLGGFGEAPAIAVDAAGDVFVGDQYNREVFEIPVSNQGSQTVVYNPTNDPSFLPQGLAVDLSGDVFIADPPEHKVLELPPGGSIPITVGFGWSSPQGVTLDAAGDLYVADSGLNEVVEIPTGCTVASCQLIVASATELSLGGNFSPYGVAVDSKGDVYIADVGLNRVDTILQQFAGLTFSESSVANISGGSPESITLQNIGNQQLTAAPPGLIIVNPSFYSVPGPGTPTDCTTSFSLAQGADCNLSIDFDPLTSGLQTGNSPFTLSGLAVFDDNSLNNTSTQAVSLTGTSLANGTSGAEYLLTVSEGGSGSGSVMDNMSAITCSESSGSVTGSCSGNYASGAQVILSASASGGSTFVSWGGACASSGTTPTCVVTMSQALNVSASFAPQADFATANVCPGGSGTGCSVTMPVTITFPNDNGSGFSDVGVQVVTEGNTGSNVDFQLAPGTYCTDIVYGAFSSCPVQVTFTPQAPGLRLGAVLVSTNEGSFTVPIYGIGQAPEVAFGPAATYTPPLTPQTPITFSSQVTELSNPPSPGGGMTTDEAGNLYQGSGTSLQKLAPPYTGPPTTVATGFSNAQSVAIDGAGNLYVADSSASNPLGGHGEVLELAPGCSSATCGTAVYSSPAPHPGPVGVAVDGLGDVFVADNPLGVFEIPANGSGQITLYNPGGSSQPDGVAVDAAGDVFIADGGLAKVVEIPAGCTTAGCQIQLGSGWVDPLGVAVDAAGDVIVADFAFVVDGQTGAGALEEVPAGCTSGSCQITLFTAGAPDPAYVTVSGTGQLFVATDGPLYEIDQSQPPSVSFSGTTNDGTTSGPDPVTIQNVGNAALSGSVGPVGTPNFAEDASSNCSSTFPLNPGVVCTEGFDFTPQYGVSGAVSDSATVSDNSLNGSPAMQTIPLSGTGAGSGSAVTVSVTGTGTGNVSSSPSLINCAIVGGVAQIGCSEVTDTGITYTFYASPIAGTAFAGWGGACSSFAPNQNCTIEITGPTNIVANFVPGLTLMVTDVGTGAGSVSSNSSASPAINNCAINNGLVTGQCAEGDPSGTQVILTASANGTSTFAGWGGACSSFGASASCTVTMNSSLNVSASFVAPGDAQPDALMPITAGVVYGQNGSFTSPNGNLGGISANSLYQPDNLTVDANGNLYVADLQNSRVLYYPAGSTTATRVYGQNGSFTNGSANAVSADSLNNPYGVAVDSSGGLYIADWNNSRVLYYAAGSTTATRVYGQGGNFTTNTANNGGATANSLNGPQSVALDSSGNLYVADTGNSRVLFYPAGSTTATQVYGQGGSFTSDIGGVGAGGLSSPFALTLDGSGNLYVADSGNNRVLFYPAGSTTATQVYGQGGSFTSNAQNNGGVSANSLFSPQGVVVDRGGNLYVADYFNSRVLFYPSGSTTATRVYGQGGSLTSNNPQTDAKSLNNPAAVALDNTGNLYVADKSNNRVVEYGPFGNVNVCPSGASTPAPCNNTITYSYYAAAPTTFGTPQVVTQGAANLDFTLGSGGTCTGTVNAGNVCTVNVQFAPSAPGLRMGAIELYDNSTPANLLATAPTYGIGQGAAAAFGPGTQTTLPTVGLNSPSRLALDGAGDLFISDYGLGEVLKLTPGGVQTTVQISGLNAGTNPPGGVAVDGAGDLFIAEEGNASVAEIPAGCTSVACQVTVPVTGLGSPYDVAVDGAGDLFIADEGKSTVVKFTPSGVQTTVPASGLHGPFGLAVDAAGDVFISDTYSNRVVEVTAAGVQTSLPANVTAPEGVWVDAAGDVFIADSIPNSRIVELPAGGGAQITVYNGNVPEGVVADGAGDLFIANTFASQVVEVNRSQAPSFAFGSINVGSSSSTQTVTLQNIGNQRLSAILPGFAVGAPNFYQISGSGTPPDCLYNFSLTPGATCDANIIFEPQIAGNPLTSTAVFTDNALNASPATQTINLSGTGVGAVTNYTLSVTDIGSGSGTVTDNSQITCTETNGSITGSSCSGTYASGTGVTLTASAMGTSTFLGWGGACAARGTSATCVVTVGATTSVTASFSKQNFGNINVCPNGSTSPAPCSGTQTVTFNLAAATTIGAIQVVTQGATGLDFALGSGSTCTGTISAGNFCGVNVIFTPLAPGLRTGAVELYDINGNLVATTPIYGIAQAPAAAFGPGAQATVYTGNPAFVSNSVAVDAAGDLFIAQAEGLYSNVGQVVKVAANGTQTTVGAGLEYPQGLAVDGAGNLYIADNNLNEVVKVTPAGVQTTVGSGLNSQLGVAVDGAGDVFFGSYGDHEVVEVPANGGPQTVVYSPVTGSGPTSNPIGLAVDAGGDLFIADVGLQEVVEVPAGCTTSGCQITIGNNWEAPQSVAVDAAGDVFVSDTTLEQVVEVPAGCTTSACQASCTPGKCAIVVASGIVSLGATVDAAGDIFIANSHASQVVAVSKSLPPSLSFALTNRGNTSADSPQTVSVQNVGNQPLTGSVGATSTTSFAENQASTCRTFTLAAGAICSEGFSFTPQSTGILTDSAIFSDNTLNLASSVVVQTVNLSGIGSVSGQTGTAVPNVVGMAEATAATTLTDSGLALGTVGSEYSSSQPAGSVIGESPAAGTPVNLGSPVALLISTGTAPPPAPNPLTFENNYFVTGDFATAGTSLRGHGSGGVATATITIPDSTPGGGQGVPDGADIVDGFLYWEALENTATPSGNSGTFLGYPITGQQIGSDLPYTDTGANLTGTLRVYRADVNAYFQVSSTWNGARVGSGAFTITLPDSGHIGPTGQFPLNEGASLVVIYRALSTTVPLKSVIIYDGSAVLTSSTTQNVQGFYDAVGGATPGEVAALYSAGGNWNSSPISVSLAADATQTTVNLNSGGAYAAVIFSTPVANSDNDGILNAWKKGPPAPDFFAGQPGYYDVKTQSWVPLPGAKQGEKDLFVQLDWMCGAVTGGVCTGEDLFPSPDPDGNDPLAMVQQAFASTGIVLHLQVGNAVPESTCTDSPGQLCQFPGEPGVVGWKNSLEFSKLWPRNFTSCAEGGDCTTRFPYGQKDSYHYVLFGHSLAIPAWNTRFGSLSAITANNTTGQTTLTTANRGAQGGINYCPSRFTISGVLSNPGLNGVYNTVSCPDAQTIILSTPGVTNWSYSFATNTPPEPAIGLTSGTVTSISGYSDLGGADSAITLALWETAPNQDMSKRAQVVAGTLFHEIGHTLGLSHGGLYYNGGSNSYVPTFDVNCKPNYQSSMNYLFQLDGVGPNSAVAYSNQTLETLSEGSLSGVTGLLDINSVPATFSTSAWYTAVAPSSTASAATLHCDGTPLTGDTGYRVDGSVAPPTPAWSQTADPNITFDGVAYTNLLGFNDVNNIDLRQVGATGGEFASLASVLNFGSSSTPLNVASGGSVTVGAGGTATVGTGGSVTLNNPGSVTVPSGAVINGGGTVIFSTGGSATLSANATNALITPGSSGKVTLPSGGAVTLNTVGDIITMTLGGTITMGGSGNITMGGSGTIILPNSGGTITIPSTGGTYTVPQGGTITLPAGGNITMGGSGNITMGGSGNITMGGSGNITMGGSGSVLLANGGTITMGGSGNFTMSGGGNITMGGSGSVLLADGGTITMGGSGNITMGGSGVVSLGGAGDVSVGAGGNVTLVAGGSVTLANGGSVTLNGSGGNITMGGSGTITMGGSGNITMGGSGNITMGPGGGTINGTNEPAGYSTSVGAGGVIGLSAGGSITVNGGAGNITMGGSGNITMNGGGTITMGGSGNITMGGSGVVALGGAGANVTLGGGGTFSLGGGGNVTMGGSGAATNEMDYSTANSFVRPPPSATYSVGQANGVQVNWTAPAFGVVQTYTISRSVIVPPSTTPGDPVVIGSVSGVNGFPPASTFTDTQTPSGTLIYTIATTLVPDTNNPTPRSSAPSPPAVLTVGQTIVLGQLPSSVSISSNSLSVTATAYSNNSPNQQMVSFGASGPCSAGSSSIDANGVSSATVTLSSTGSCTITASQPGDSTTTQSGITAYSAATPVSGTFTILPQGSTTQSQFITIGALPSVTYGKGFSVSATSSAGLAVSFTASGPCTVGTTTGTASGATTGAGLCKITATAPAGQANNKTYSAASVTQSFTILTAPLTVTANSIAMAYGQAIPTLTYTFGSLVNGDSLTGNNPAVSGTPALSTTATSSSPDGPYPITVSTGSLAAANYSFVFVPGTLTISGATITVLPSSINFGAVAVGSVTTKTVTVSNTGNAAATISSPFISLLQAGNSDEFVVVNLCPSSLAAGKSCTITVSFVAGAYYNTPQTAILKVMDNVPGTPPQVSLSATILIPQTITFGPNSPPASAAFNTSFTVVATGGASGNAVTFTSSGSCSNVGTKYTMTSGTGTCSVIANQAGNSTYAAAAQVTKSVTATLAAQTITFTTNAPSSAAYNSSFPVAASASSALTVTFTSSGSCSNSVATYKMTSGTGTCSVIASQAGNSNYSAAPQVKQTVSAILAAQAITFTTNAPSSAAYKSSFTVAATGGGSGNAVTFTSSGACSNSGAKYTMTSGTGTCSVIANQAGTTTYYSAAPQVKQTATATLAAQAITFTTNAPSSAAYKSSFTVAATGGGSGNAVTFTSSGACSNSGAKYTMTSGTGTCSVIANQAGTANYYSAAPQATQTATATLAAQAITFTTNPPSSAANKSSFTVAATGGASGNAVTFTSSGSCSNSGAKYTMTSSTGTCSVIANQTGTTNYYSAAPQVTKNVTATH